VREFLLNELEVLPGCNDPRLHDPLVVRRVTILLGVRVGVCLPTLSQVDLDVLLGDGIFLLKFYNRFYDIKCIDFAALREAKTRMIIWISYLD
jgi:hypothetical protein